MTLNAFLSRRKQHNDIWKYQINSPIYFWEEDSGKILEAPYLKKSVFFQMDDIGTCISFCVIGISLVGGQQI